MLTTILVAAMSNPGTVYEIVAADRKMVFAGKLGQRIEETLTLSANGTTFSVRLSPVHTRFGIPQAYRAGEKITISGSTVGRIFRHAINRK